MISVYRGARNSLSYNLVIPFKDGVTFAVTTATQSLQQSYLESVADMTYVAVTNFFGWERGKGLYDLRHKTIVYVLLIFDVWTKRKKKVSTLQMFAGNYRDSTGKSECRDFKFMGIACTYTHNPCNFEIPHSYFHCNICREFDFTGILRGSVMRVGSDTFGDPIFQKGLQN